MGEGIAFFGYGSLVNELTWARKYRMIPAEVIGWKREWKHCVETPWGPICALTVAPDSASRLSGVFIMTDPVELKILDEREIGYRRLMLAHSSVRSSSEVPEELFIYASEPQAYRDGSLDFPLWLSYVEVVIYGYWKVFGDAGVEEFVKSTGGWQTPLLDDRAKPLYPRFMQLSPEERLFMDGKLATIEGLGVAGPRGDR